MTRWAAWLPALPLLFALAAPAHAVLPSISILRLAITIDLRPDGTATIIQQRRASPASRAAAAQVGQFAIGFNPTLQKVDVTEAYTLKRDGSRIDADLGQVRTQLAAGVPSAPIFRDIQQKVVIFPDLAEQDVAVVTYRDEITTPLFPGNFTWQMNFNPTIAWEDVDLTITAPASMVLNSEQVGVAFERSVADGVQTLRWRYRAPDVVAEDIAATSAWDRLPRLFVSTFPDYAAFAAAYAARSDAMAEVTPKIQAKADEITQGIADHRAQARAIYEWVSSHIRYVALYLGTGGVVPHAAEAVLANGYGDCKDHTVLFEALLRAKGIAVQSALINLDNAYTLSAVPTLAQLDHVISYLPEFDLYADTTTAVAPFGTLPFQEYGKPVVLAGGEGDPLRHIPVLAAGLARITATTDAWLQLDGAMSGNTRIEATGPAAIALRLAARWVQTQGHEGAARRQLVALGQQGTGVYSFAAPDGFESIYAVNGRFKLEPLPEVLESDSFGPPLGPLLLIRPGDYFLGPLNRTTLPADAPTPCFSGQQTEILRLTLPEGRLPLRLPKDRRIENAAFTYASHWSLDGQVVSVKRTLVAAFDAPLCTGALRRDTAAALALIRRDQRAKIVLNEP
jgi:hypothetical protein